MGDRRVGGRVGVGATSYAIYFFTFAPRSTPFFLFVFLSLSSRSNRFHSDSVHDARRYEAIEPRSFRGLELEISHSREYHLARVNERVHGTFPSNRFPTIVFRLMSFSSLTLIRHYRGIKRTL